MANILLIHGVLMPRFVMWPLAIRLRKYGHTVTFYNYPFRPKEKDLAESLIQHVEQQKPDVIVGHSLGGVIAVKNAQKIEQYVKTVICLGSPLGGSSMARRISESPLRRIVSQAARITLINGVAVPETSIHVVSLAGSNSRFGVRLLFPIFNGTNDGTVALHETKIKNLSDWREVGVGHTTFVYAKVVVEIIEQILKKYGI
jgi:pimeloyl-ACP methyl ester carboxylesterase